MSDALAQVYEVAVFDRVLTEDEVERIVAGGVEALFPERPMFHQRRGLPWLGTRDRRE